MYCLFQSPNNFKTIGTYWYIKMPLSARVILFSQKCVSLITIVSKIFFDNERLKWKSARYVNIVHPIYKELWLDLKLLIKFVMQLPCVLRMFMWSYLVIVSRKVRWQGDRAMQGDTMVHLVAVGLSRLDQQVTRAAEPVLGLDHPPGPADHLWTSRRYVVSAVSLYTT